MARYTDASCKLCRRHGEKLFLKGTKCSTDKCPLARRPFPPGQHGKRRKKVSDYGVQVKEKQKVRRIYGVLERQFRHYFRMASRSKGVTGEMLLELLERRLDNTVYRLCFAFSRNHARQIVRSKLVRVNSRNVNIPSYLVKIGDKIEIKPKEKIEKLVRETKEILKDRPIPSWLKRESEELKAEVIGLPTREDVGFPVDENLIVELYSK
ncbi:MAG: 30S ribosomal protein S4 [Candidatus Omnitrophica bacterium]|nr:30S ribosomal protein S4 [Candidatus Omnitrophota bacterium]